MKKLFIIIPLLLCLSFFSTGTYSSKADGLLSKNNRIEKGSKTKIDFFWYYGKKKVKWKTSNKNIKILSKGKDWCKIKGIKAGTSYVIYKIGKKTYKKKIKVIKKQTATHKNFKKLKLDMTFDEVEDILGNYSEIESTDMNTENEYEYKLRCCEEDGDWDIYGDELYREKVVYKWINKITYKSIRCTFNDGVLVKKEYNNFY